MSDKDGEKLPTAIAAGLIGAGGAAAGILDPGLGVLAAGVAPTISGQMNDIVKDRIMFIRLALGYYGIDLNKLATSEEEVTKEKALLLEEVLKASLSTDAKEKVALLVRVLKAGFDSEFDEETITMRRFVRTIARIDEVELRCLSVLGEKLSASGDIRLADLSASFKFRNPDLVRSAMAVLASEGLAYTSTAMGEGWRISDFGLRFIAELKEASSDLGEIE